MTKSGRKKSKKSEKDVSGDEKEGYASDASMLQTPVQSSKVSTPVPPGEGARPKTTRRNAAKPPTDLHVDSPGDTLGSSPMHTTEHVDNYFVTMTMKFEAMIKSAMESLMQSMKRIEQDLGASIDFATERIKDLQADNKALENRISELEKEMEKDKAGINKAERFSRRNNVRLVGIDEAPGEDCISIVQDILNEKFATDPRIERAHRDGKPSARPRHILFKFLSFRDKVAVMRAARATLAKENYFLVDDLTKEDLLEKRKYSKEVQALYQHGTKLKFTAGKWRHRNGITFDFSKSQQEVEADSM